MEPKELYLKNSIIKKINTAKSQQFEFNLEKMNFSISEEKRKKNRNNSNLNNPPPNIYNNCTNFKDHSDKNQNKVNKLRLSKISKTNKLLDLEILSSWNLPKGFLLHINRFGIENSLRKKYDGITFFGYEKENHDSNKNYNIDYIISPKDLSIIDEKYIGRHFQIKYDENINNYYIKDLGFGFGVFVKLDKEILIKQNLLINIGETYIIFYINKNELKLKIFRDSEKTIEYTFNGEENDYILIGRNNNSDVYIEDKMLSRIQCNIFYKNDGWFLKDGDLQGKASTNRTWFYCSDETLIYNEMIFKTNHILFKCILKE